MIFFSIVQRFRVHCLLIFILAIAQIALASHHHQAQVSLYEKGRGYFQELERASLMKRSLAELTSDQVLHQKIIDQHYTYQRDREENF